MAVEERRASCRALQATAKDHAAIKTSCAPPWQLNQTGFETAALVLGAERGNDWVNMQLNAAAYALDMGGALWLAGNRKAGFERYFKWARKLLGRGQIVSRNKDTRIAVLQKTQTVPKPSPQEFLINTKLRGHELRFYTLPGVFSANEIDPASRLLLDFLPKKVAGEEILDLGAGYGALSLPLALDGAKVTLVEQSLVAVISSRNNFANANATARILHSDVDEALQKEDLFDIVVSNPPFHIGGHVVLDVAKAFVAAAHSRLRPGGRFYLVANPFLKYESWMQNLFGNVHEHITGRYKVLSAIKQ